MLENFVWLYDLDWSESHGAIQCVDCGEKIKEYQDYKFIVCESTHHDECICKSCFEKRLNEISHDYKIPRLECRWEGSERKFKRLEDEYKNKLFHSDEHRFLGVDEQVIAYYRAPSSTRDIYILTTRQIIIPWKEISFWDITSIGFDEEGIEIQYRKSGFFNTNSFSIENAELKEVPYENRRDFCNLLICLIYLFNSTGDCSCCNRKNDFVIWNEDKDKQWSNTKMNIFFRNLNDEILEEKNILLCPSCYVKYMEKQEAAVELKNNNITEITKIRAIYPEAMICDQCHHMLYHYKFMEIKESFRPAKCLCQKCFQKAYPSDESEVKVLHDGASRSHSNNQGGKKKEYSMQEGKEIGKNANPWAALLASLENDFMETDTATVQEVATASMNATETNNSWAELLAAAEHGVNKEGKVENLDALLEELNRLIGLAAVKEEIHSLINIIQINNRRKSLGIATVPMSKHLVFSGNPGTGKTTVARLLAKIYGKLEILSKGHLIEVDRAGLVAGYVGQTATKTLEVIQKALGGILFIDEAYSLTVGKGDTDYGFEAVDTLLKAMEDHRDDFVVVVAGYPDQMEEFLESNPGLRSRFNTFIHFEDYKPDELLDIFRLSCRNNHYRMGEGVEEHLLTVFTDMYEHRGKDFANGREVRNLFEKSIARQANRLAQDGVLDDEKLVTLEVADL